MWNFLGTVGEYLSWLYHDRQWATWELIGLVIVLLVVPVWIFKRLRRRPARRAYGSHFLDGASVIGVKLADQSRNRHNGANHGKTDSMRSIGTRAKQENTGRKTRSWRKAVEQIRQKPTEKKLEADLAELTAAYEQPREQAGEDTKTAETTSSTASAQQVNRESADSEQPQTNSEPKVSKPEESTQTIESLEQRIVELTSANEKLQQELAETRQAAEPLEKELAGQTSVNEELRKEVEAIKQAEARLEQKVTQLTAANEQLKQKVVGSGTKDDDYEQRHRVVEGVNEKLCGKCSQWKAEDQYHRHASSRDGLANQCKQCRAEAARKRRQKRNVS